METRKKSDLFVIVVAGLVNDIKDQFLLNYYTARIFYNNMNLAAFSAEMKILNIKDDTIKKMWYDETYGFGKLSSFNVYMRMLILGKTRIKTYLKNYFDISEYQINKIVSNNKLDDGWLYNFKETYKNDIDKEYELDCKKDTVLGEGERTQYCDQTDLTFIQWGTRDLTTDIDLVSLL